MLHPHYFVFQCARVPTQTVYPLRVENPFCASITLRICFRIFSSSSCGHRVAAHVVNESCVSRSCLLLVACCSVHLAPCCFSPQALILQVYPSHEASRVERLVSKASSPNPLLPCASSSCHLIECPLCIERITQQPHIQNSTTTRAR